MILNATSGGRDSGAPPIFEWHDEDVEKAAVFAEAWNTGMKEDDGIDDPVHCAVLATLRQRRRADVNIVSRVGEDNQFWLIQQHTKEMEP